MCRTSPDLMPLQLPMANAREIPLAKLRLDTTNPRLDDGRETQRDALRSMMEAQGDKVVALARDIGRNGLSPIDRFLVVQAEDDPEEFVVLEGNRRITALKLLANPDLGDGALRSSQVKSLRELAQGSDFYENSGIDCAVLGTRDEADHWLRLRHGGEMGGAGVVDWGATEKARYNARSGKASPELQILGFLTKHGIITDDEANEISITSLRRLLSDGAVRRKLGIEIDRKNQAVKTHFPLKETLKGLGKVAHEMAADDFRVKKIYDDHARKTFMAGFRARDLPKANTRLGGAVELGAADVGHGGSGAAGRAKRKGSGRSKERTTVAPGSLRLNIVQSRLRDIYRELQQLKLERHTNAGAVLLRVFTELTVDHYIKKHKLTVRQNPDLKDNLQVVHDDLLAKNVMGRGELAPIRKAISDPGLLVSSVSTFNLYVHSYNLSPSPRDVRTAWDNLQLFFERIWQ